MKQKKIGFIGLGLIGGSIAKAIRRYYPDYEIVAFDKNRETLALATQESIINVACTSIDDNFRGCNYIFLCAPVAFNTAYLKQMMPNYLFHATHFCNFFYIFIISTFYTNALIEKSFFRPFEKAQSKKCIFLSTLSFLLLC